MLYDAAIRHCESGKAAIRAGVIEQQNDYLTKAQRIVSELMCSLDMEHGGEIAQNLLGLYTYCNNELVNANIEDRPECVDNAIGVLNELRDAWRTIAVQIEPEERIAA
jgi:flagellar protein FliS